MSLSPNWGPHVNLDEVDDRENHLAIQVMREQPRLLERDAQRSLGYERVTLWAKAEVRRMEQERIGGKKLLRRELPKLPNLPKEVTS